MNQSMVKRWKVGFLGAGTMAQAMIRAMIESGHYSSDQIHVTNRSQGKLQKVEQLHGVKVLKNNEELFDHCDVIVVAVKPQDLGEALEPLSSVVTDEHIVMSLAAGISMDQIRKMLPHGRLVRVMPNTPIHIRKAVIGFAVQSNAEVLANQVKSFLEPMGLVVQVQEGEMFEALTVSCGSGTGFIFELMVYWQDWIEEHGFDTDLARQMVVETFLGAALLAEQSPHMSLEELQDRVASKKGVTAAGLESMRETQLERGLRVSFEKAAMRDRALGKNMK